MGPRPDLAAAPSQKSIAMAPTEKDPTEALRQRAAEYPGVDEGTACTQSSFKVRGKSFLFVGEQGGRYKVMLKLGESLPEARELAAAQPDNFQAGGKGKTAWVTLRFSAGDAPAAKLWRRWLDESFALFAAGAKAPARKKATKKGAKKST
ncbi:MAG: MmcQ/YjbR family DNA-binding protein [Planctomycetota bacterium]|nr:MmcQ/YjbR family DNA-binding protein [Planctomycetota bacterium]